MLRTLVSGDQRIATGVKADRNRDLANSINYLTPDGIMLIGIFADSHDHLDHIQRAVEVFNQAGCELVVFAGDLVSSFAVPPLRKLNCKVIACYGDNEGNKIGVAAGMKIIGTMGEPPFSFKTADGRLVTTYNDLTVLRYKQEGVK